MALTKRSAIVFAVFTLLFGLLTVSSSLQKSPTVDEPVHLLAGYSYLKWDDFRTNPEHPPLAKILAALPLLALDIQDPRPSSPEWEMIPESEPGDPAVSVAQQMLFVQNDADKLFFYAKLPLIALAVLLGVFVYRWSKGLFGLEAAIASLFLYAFDPNILAHSPMVHTDIPFATFFFISTYFLWRALTHLTWPNLLLTSLPFGLAAITKYSYPIILLIWTALGLVRIFSSEALRWRIGVRRTISDRWVKSAAVAGLFLSALATAYFFTWAIYGFRFAAIAGGERHFAMASVMPKSPFLQAWASFLYEHRLFPEAWIYGQLFVLKGLRRTVYFLGQISDQGFWLYFPVAFAVKTPLPVLLLLVLTVGVWFFKRKERTAGLFLLIPVVLYFSIAVWSRLNIGFRHILPIYPFLFVLIGGVVAELWKDRSWIKRGGLVFLGLWYLWSSVSIYPHYLAFFNELAGGSKNGHKVLLDSNLDWGQDLKGLKSWMGSHQVKKIQFLYFGKADPKYYGIEAFYLPGSWVMHEYPDGENFEVPEHLAISSNFVYGGRLFLTDRQKEFLDSFGLGTAVANIGYSIFVYKLDPADPRLYYNMGFVLAGRGKFERALELFRRALRVQPNFAEAHESLGRVLALQGKTEEAIQHFQEALRLLKSRSERRSQP